MNVVFLGNALSLVSGHARPAWQMARCLRGDGHQVRLIGSESGLAGMSERQRAVVDEEGFTEIWRERIEYPREGLREGGAGLRRTLEKVLSHADLLHVFDLRSLRSLHRMFAGRLPAPALLQVAGLLNLRYEHFRSAGPGSLLQALTIPAHVIGAITPRWYVARLLRLPDAVLCTSRYIRDALHGQYGVPMERLHVVHPGVEVPDGEPGKQDDRPDFICFGWPGAHRGTLDAAEAFARFLRDHPGARCEVCAFRYTRLFGEDTLIQLALRGRFARAGVRQMGFLPDIRRRLVGVRAALLPFRSPFGYAQPPVVVLEAMAAGVPVISTDVGSVTEVVRDGVNGFIVAPRDVPAMVDRLRRLWADDALRASLSAVARRTVSRDYCLETQLARTRDLYEKLIRN